MSPPDLLWLAVQALILLLGLSVGSFLNVCIARMPENRSVIWPPSHCPHCGARIRLHDNVPVLSWLLLRGRCRDCGSPISPHYPLVELSTGLLVLALWEHLVPEPQFLTLPRLAAFAYYLLFAAMLLASSFIDLQHGIIPDEFSIYAVPVGVLGAWLVSGLDPSLAPSWRQSLVGAAVGGGLLLLVAGAYYLLRREAGIGMGDVKLLAMMGSFLGPFPALFVILLVGSVVGSLVGVGLLLLRRGGLRAAVPFGPFLALGGLVQLFYGHALARLLLLELPLVF